MRALRCASCGSGKPQTSPAYGPTRANRSTLWQARFYDFVVYTKKKKLEKLHYMHQNPVKRRLVLEPQQWAGAAIAIVFWTSLGEC